MESIEALGEGMLVPEEAKEMDTPQLNEGQFGRDLKKCIELKQVYLLQKHYGCSLLAL